MGEERDIKSAFLQIFENKLLSHFNSTEILSIRNALLDSLQSFDIVQKSSELILYDDSNENLILSYLGCCKVDGKSDRTIKEYSRVIYKFAGAVGKNLIDVNSYDIRTYMAVEMRRGVSNRTIETERCYISSFYRWLLNDGVINKNPCSAIKPVKYKQTVELAFSDIEIDAIRNTKMSIRNRAIIEVLLSSGIRASELEKLDRNDVNILERTIHVRDGKGGKDRITYISKIASHYLQKYLKTRLDSDKALFISASNNTKNKQNKRYDADSLRKTVSNIGDKAGVENVHPHRFRRTFATSLYNSGMDLHEIQRLMGHAEISTTLTYISSDDETLRISYQKHIM